MLEPWGDLVSLRGRSSRQMMKKKRLTVASVVASRQWTAPDGSRAPAGTVHAWVPSTNQTVCGLALKRERLWWFPHISWADVQPATGRHGDEVSEVCPKCAAGMGVRRGQKRWTRNEPRS
jgi:hypothetical protein